MTARLSTERYTITVHGIKCPVLACDSDISIVSLSQRTEVVERTGYVASERTTATMIEGVCAFCGTRVRVEGVDLDVVMEPRQIKEPEVTEPECLPLPAPYIDEYGRPLRAEDDGA